MHRATARLVAVALRRNRRSARICVGAPGDGLALGMRTQILALEVTQFVLRAEILGREARAALEPDHAHSHFAQLGREDAAGRADADDHDISFFGCHGSRSPLSSPVMRGLGARIHVFAASSKTWMAPQRGPDR